MFGEGEVNEGLRRMALLEDVERECFYGECLGFQVRWIVGVRGEGRWGAEGGRGRRVKGRGGMRGWDW